MQHRKLWIPLALTIGALLVAGCGGKSAGDEEASGPATVEEIAGTDLSRITLTPKAVERLDIQTAAVRSATGKQTVIPYSAVFYEANGDTWAYVSPKPLTFVRQRIVVEHIDGAQAVLSEGPTPGTKVATVGVAELFGAESGLGQ